MASELISTTVGALECHRLGEGPPVVLWGSLFVDHRSWNGVAENLAGDHQVIMINGPGHGRSGDPGRHYTQDECADAALEVLAASGISGLVDWVGNAWGGAVGVILAARRPSVVRSLVMLSTPIAVYSPAEQRRTQLLLGLHRLLGMRGPLPRTIAAALLSKTTMQTNPMAVETVCAGLRRFDRRMLRSAVQSISLDRPDLTPLLPEVDAPTLVVTGADHPGLTPQQAQQAASTLKRGRAAVVDDSAYLLPLEAPGRTIALIREFWMASNRTTP
jgi:pimeloyl-ACP methyl ester carboxylesterase